MLTWAICWMAWAGTGIGEEELAILLFCSIVMDGGLLAFVFTILFG